MTSAYSGRRALGDAMSCGVGRVKSRRRQTMRALAIAGLAAWPLLAHFGSDAARAAGATTTIRTSSASRVPACVQPDRLMAFLATRNPELPPKFRDLSMHYKRHGEAWGVRWDYAFFQMVLETNYLMFRRADGTPGDVRPRQNNFAGLGTTGNGVPGDSYPDVSTGVLAQIQHLVVYSGERIRVPVGIRTRLKQDDILHSSRRIAMRRPMSFQDLSGRWASDRKYGRSIEAIAERYRAMFCNGQEARWQASVSPAIEARGGERAVPAGAIGLANEPGRPAR
jgi:hypothetical protein